MLLDGEVVIVPVAPVTVVQRRTHVDEVPATSAADAGPCVIAPSVVRVVGVSRLLHVVSDVALVEFYVATSAAVASDSARSIGFLDHADLVHAVNVDDPVALERRHVGPDCHIEIACPEVN